MTERINYSDMMKALGVAILEVSAAEKQWELYINPEKK